MSVCLSLLFFLFATNVFFFLFLFLLLAVRLFLSPAYLSVIAFAILLFLSVCPSLWTLLCYKSLFLLPFFVTRSTLNRLFVLSFSQLPSHCLLLTRSAYLYPGC